MKHYVYVWRDASGVPFYVGKGRGARANTIRNRSQEFRDIYSSGVCSVEIVGEFLDESEAFQFERRLISSLGRRDSGTGPLVNRTSGGQGPSGAKRSPESIERMRVAQRRADTPERRERRRIAQTGKKLSLDTREKIGASKRGIPRSDATRAKISESHKGKTLSEDHKEKLRISHTGKKLSEEHKRRVGLSQKGKTNSPDARQLMSLASRMAPPKHGVFKGISFMKANKKWHAQITVRGKRRHLGFHEDIETAARAYDSAAIDAWGNGNCYLNFPDDYRLEAAE